MTSLASGSKITFLVHHLKKSKKGASSAGTISLSYKPTKLGTVVMSVSGKSKSGKGFGRTFKTLVIARPATHAKAHDVTADISPAPQTATAGMSPIVDTTLSSVQALPSSGVSLDAGDVSLLAITLLGGVGCVGGLVVSGRVGRRS